MLKKPRKGLFSFLNKNKEKEKSDPKTIFLIGSTGKGKSTLANVLIDKDNNFEEIFKESGASVSGTREIQKEEFIESNSGISYSVIDTVGMGDTKLKQNEVLDKIAEAVYLAREGISRVFFVIGNKFDQSEMANYDLLKAIIFDKEVVNHTTIVRTRFEDFKDKEKCKKDIDLMIKEGGKLAEIIKLGRKKIVYVDNPSLNLLPDDAEDEVERKKAEEEVANEITSRKETRSASREILLKHLQKKCSDQKKDYKPKKLKALGSEIADDMDNLLQSRKELEEEMKKLKVSVSNSTDNKFSKIEDNNNQELSEEEDNLAIGKIKELEDKKAGLQREIEEKEKIIRQKVLKHIFNNYDGINNELGGNIFLESVIEDNNDWKTISQAFADQKLVLEWKSKGFDYYQLQKWALALGNEFNPEHDVGFCAWLRDDKQLTVEKIKELSHVCNIEQLRKEYIKLLEKETEILHKHNHLSRRREMDAKLERFFGPRPPQPPNANDNLNQKKLRNFFGQRPPSELISLNLTEYFPGHDLYEPITEDTNDSTVIASKDNNSKNQKLLVEVQQKQKEDQEKQSHIQIPPK